MQQAVAEGTSGGQGKVQDASIKFPFLFWGHTAPTCLCQQRWSLKTFSQTTFKPKKTTEVTVDFDAWGYFYFSEWWDLLLMVFLVRNQRAALLASSSVALQQQRSLRAKGKEMEPSRQNLLPLPLTISRQEADTHEG